MTSDQPLTGAELARWCYENPNLAASTIEGLRAGPAATPTIPKPPYPEGEADKKLAADWYTWGFQVGMDAARKAPAAAPLEPVAWQWRYVSETEWKTQSGGAKLTDGELRNLQPIEQRPLYASPVPRPRVETLDEVSSQRDALVKALQDIIEENDEFRKGMPDEWDGDPLEDACNAAKAVLVLVGRSQEPQETE